MRQDKYWSFFQIKIIAYCLRVWWGDHTSGVSFSKPGHEAMYLEVRVEERSNAQVVLEDERFQHITTVPVRVWPQAVPITTADRGMHMIE